MRYVSYIIIIIFSKKVSSNLAYFEPLLLNPLFVPGHEMSGGLGHLAPKW